MDEGGTREESWREKGRGKGEERERPERCGPRRRESVRKARTEEKGRKARKTRTELERLSFQI
jgi:hypothetical protein